MATQATLDAVQKLYIAYLGRAADKAGLDFWANAIESGVSTLESVATGFTLTPEYSSIYGNLSSDALVEQIYQNTFGRASDAEGKAFWVSQLATGAVTADTIAFTMINIMGDVDKALVDQKVVASNTYTQTAGENYDVNAGKSVLTDINAGTETPAPTPTPTPTVTVITSTAERDEITLGAGTFKFVVEAGTPASPDYQAAVGTPEVGTPASSDYVPASPDYQAAVGTPEVGTPASPDYAPASPDYQAAVGTPASPDYAPASPDYQAAVGTPEVGTPASPDYAPASPDYQAAVGTPEIGTPASPDYVPASPDYQPAVGIEGDPDYVPEIGTPEVGTPASPDYVPASPDYQAAIGTPEVGTPASPDYAPASPDYQAAIGTPEVGTPASPDYQAAIGTPEVGTPASPDYAPASPDYQAAVGTPEVGTPASSDYVPASPDYQPAVGTPGTASASAAINDGYDIIGGFNISTDKLDLPETTLLTGTFDTVATGNSLSITSNSNGIVQFGNTTGSTTIADKVSALLTAMGATKSTAAFVDSGNTYVVQGDGVAGAQASDILVELTGVSTALDLSTFIV